MSSLTKQIVTIPIVGMEREHDASILQKNIQKISDVVAVKVEFNNQRALVTLDAETAIDKCIKMIKDLGYEVPIVRSTIPVLNMMCASCAATTQKAVRNAAGVLHADVNYGTGNLTVAFFPGVTSPQLLQKAVQNSGYDLLLEDEETQQEELEKLEKKQYQTLKFKTIWAIILGIPLLLLGMVWMHAPYADWLMAILATPMVFWLGNIFFRNAWKQLKHRSANMDTLVALSTGIAYLFSIFNLFFASFWTSRGLEAHVYFEAAGMIVAFILLGRLLEAKAKGNTSAAIKKLMGLQPNTVVILDAEGNEREIPIQQVEVGDTLLVKPGEKIAVDGKVLSGTSYVDESMLSGEAIPVLKEENSPVFAGTINQKGSFRFQAEKVGKSTLLAQIIKTVQEAQGSKAPVQNLVDKIAAIFVPTVMGIALLALFSWIFLGGENGFVHGLLAAVTVLVIACPCALGLATPTAIMVGVGKGAENGILIKDADGLERSKIISAVVLDKTGTITEGKPTVVDAQWLQCGNATKSILRAMESRSEHPLAAAVTEYLKAVDVVELFDFESITGKGIRAEYAGENYYAGSISWLMEKQLFLDAQLAAKVKVGEEQAQTMIGFADEKNILGVLAISDKIKDSSKTAIEKLQQAGIEVFMLTGDNEATAKAIAKQVGIRHYKAQVLPQDKANFVKQLQAKGKVVAMVGDGINDSTALALSDVSIAMGRGSDIAMEVAKMTIISSDLMKIPQAIQLSKRTVRTIHQNLFWAFIYNLIGIPIAAGVLYAFNGFLLNPMIAGAAMAMSSVSVVSNSLRLKGLKL